LQFLPIIRNVEFIDITIIKSWRFATDGELQEYVLARAQRDPFSV